MRVAGSIILGVIGAILYFAVQVDAEGFSIQTAGLIMMVAAAIWFVLELVRGMAGNRVASSQTVQRSDGSVERVETEVHEQKTTPPAI